jgi:hypothetical protein
MRSGSNARQRSEAPATTRRKAAAGQRARPTRPQPWQPWPKSGSRPGKGILNYARITIRDWMTLPVDTLVVRKFLGISLQRLELRCTSNTVHYVLNQEHARDSLLTSNELKRVLSKTLKFCPTPNMIKSTTIAGDCDVLGHHLIKTFNRFVCKDFIKRAKVNS